VRRHGLRRVLYCGGAPQTGLTSGIGSPSPTVGRVLRYEAVRHARHHAQNPAFRKRLKRRGYFFATVFPGTDYRVKLRAALTEARFSFVSSKSSHRSKR
jgi:hypothetical protein